MQGITFRCIPQAQLSPPHFLPFLNNYQPGSFQAFCSGNKRHFLFTVPVISYWNSTWMDWESRRLSRHFKHPSGCLFSKVSGSPCSHPDPWIITFTTQEDAPMWDQHKHHSIFLSTAGHHLSQNPPSVCHRQNPLRPNVPFPEAANISLPFAPHLQSIGSPQNLPVSC